MKKSIAGCLLAGVILLFGLFFSGLGGISYTAQGTSGALHLLSLIMSTVYIVLFLAAAVWLGYQKSTPCFVTYGILLVVVGVMGLMGYLGYGVLLGGLDSIYFLLVTPFAAVIEQIALSFHMYHAVDRLLLIVPLVLYFLAMLSYIAGTILRAHERALYYQLMRFDSRYEYRMPLEESAEETYTA